MSDPKRTHPFTKGDGTVREYLWISDKPCHVCNPYGQLEGRVLGVLSDLEGTLVTECLNCAEEDRHRSNDFKFLHPPPKVEPEAKD